MSFEFVFLETIREIAQKNRMGVWKRVCLQDSESVKITKQEQSLD